MTAKLNLAPEVYQAGQRAKRKKQIATSIGIAVGTIAGGFVVACLIIMGGQSAYVANLNGQIKERQNTVKGFEMLPQAATTAEHLASLKRLANERIYLTNFFRVLQTVTPEGVAVSAVTLGDDRTLTVSGNARSYSLITKFAKALEASNVEIGDSASQNNQPFFKGLQLSTVTQAGNGGLVDFKLTVNVAPEVTTNGHK
jgi:Tfp pilus assembly protein PilN